MMRFPVQTLLMTTVTTLGVNFVTAAAHAFTIWSGPTVTYAQPGTDSSVAANQDRLTDNVWLTRSNIQGLFNIRQESAYQEVLPSPSPVDTEWAYGTTAQIGSLTFQPWATWHGGRGAGPPSTIGRDAVLHLISDDIYLDIKFTAWGLRGAGGFAYERSSPTPEAVIPTPALLPGLIGLGLAALKSKAA